MRKEPNERMMNGDKGSRGGRKAEDGTIETHVGTKVWEVEGEGREAWIN